MTAKLHGLHVLPACVFKHCLCSLRMRSCEERARRWVRVCKRLKDESFDCHEKGLTVELSGARAAV
jgi:hypothetical protein